MPQNVHLQQAVLAELSREPSVSAENIGVAADEGVVTLLGHVESLAERHAAEAAAIRVRGVRAVADELEVRLAAHAKRSDEDLAAAIAERLAWNGSVPKGAVSVVVRGGRVTLVGEVQWNFEREAAERDLRGLIGVVEVANEIVVKPTITASQVSDDIVHALHRSWFFDPKTVNVDLEDGTVHLTGTVRSHHEKQLAAEAAWAEPGVVDVINDLSIE